ncbi:MAG: histidine phosphatase family protein [Candidatus Solibacter sp.]|nr:histidine phosphatase family protein [Candidatus Solibacter sp.]
MKRLRLGILVLTAAMLAPGSAMGAPAVVILVRHAEKEALPADDPGLTPAGKQRAAELARVVATWKAAGATVKALFASDAKRTQQTLAPLATATLPVTQVKAADTAALVKKILAVQGGVVVVAGHSNTVPAVIQALGGAAGITIDDAEFSRLFVVTGAGGKAVVVAMRYGNP